jgi:hypothetical protein
MLPVEFKKYFWDCDFKELSIDSYPRFIAERLLVYGNTKDIKWLRTHISEDIFLNIATSSRRLDKRTLNFWKKYFGIGQD